MSEEIKQKYYHVCQSIAGLERILAEQILEKGKPVDWLMVDDRPATISDILFAIEDAKAKGYEVLPPCDNVETTGHCAGHDVD